MVFEQEAFVEAGNGTVVHFLIIELAALLRQAQYIACFSKNNLVKIANELDIPNKPILGVGQYGWKELFINDEFVVMRIFNAHIVFNIFSHLHLFDAVVAPLKDHIERLSHNTEIIDQVYSQSGLVFIVEVLLEPFGQFVGSKDYLLSSYIFTVSSGSEGIEDVKIACFDIKGIQFLNC